MALSEYMNFNVLHIIESSAVLEDFIRFNLLFVLIYSEKLNISNFFRLQLNPSKDLVMYLEASLQLW